MHDLDYEKKPRRYGSHACTQDLIATEPQAREPQYCGHQEVIDLILSISSSREYYVGIIAAILMANHCLNQRGAERWLILDINTIFMSDAIPTQ